MAYLSTTQGKTIYNIGDLYDLYYKDCIKNPIEKSIFIKLIREFNKQIMQKIINGYTYILPYSLGNIYVKKKKQVIDVTADNKLAFVKNRPRIDFKATRELRKSDPIANANKTNVYYLNEHTDGYRMSFFWCKYTGTSHGVRNMTYYNFKPSIRKGSRQLAKVLKSGTNNTYYL